MVVISTKGPHFCVNEQFENSDANMYLSIEWEGQMEKYLAQGHDRPTTEPVHNLPLKNWTPK